MTPSSTSPAVPAAHEAITLLRACGDTVATAESLTGGLVAAALTEVPGSSWVVLGGVVAYASAVKASLLGVSPDLLEHGGAVQAEVASAMAANARRVFGAQWGISTTGVAGPDPADGRPVGTVYVGLSGPEGDTVTVLNLTGDRAQIRAATVLASLDRLTGAVRAHVAGPSGYR
ncbi:MAG: nicotinamide-nucleotide amidohydrolase family protein [Austwickia sp.]|jgi:nicotinamide-nucleotide amidase|nr:nicotinamide-nucleotide amidohydrolase family protein [Austwickia sp.]MBK8435029.1 nicotinamide-nucleotide amidohydrolase family protein [Austwickia sp.]MBK9101416.1 nicotinamide-nucleotide amidohydrolase family protein [Austwickia sp.]